MEHFYNIVAEILNVLATTLLGNLTEPLELAHPNTCAEAKLCLFLFMPVLGIVCRKIKVLKQLVQAKYK